MPIHLPNLDTKTFDEISNEMLASIPKYTDRWTNYNPSDPGITILELLSWIAETTLYRINRIPDESYVNFLRLAAGASGTDEVTQLLDLPGLDRSHRRILKFLQGIEEGNKKSTADIRAAVLQFLKSRYRAVTEDDIRTLTIEATDHDSEKVKRAVVFSEDNAVHIVIVPEKWDDYEKRAEAYRQESYHTLIACVERYLSPRMLIGTVIKVKQPIFTDITLDIKVMCQHFAIVKKVEDSIRTRIKEHLDVFSGGDEKKGWPYKRPLTIYEIAQIIEETDGVKQAESIIIDGDRELKIKTTVGFHNLTAVNIRVEKERT